LVYAGAKAIGLDELRHIKYERGELCFPYDYPTTPEYELYRQEANENLVIKYFRRPTANRMNYTKIGSFFPLIPPISVFGPNVVAV
jgi:ribonuclease P/MRP protein subunit POP1